MSGSGAAGADPQHRGHAREVFIAFLRLGLSAFGGPIAHLAYFRSEFVERRRWLDERAYADLVALCQLLPGPTSSQVGLALGLQRAGWSGALAAWAGFTLPSAALLIGLAQGLLHHPALAAAGAVHGLKVVAVAIVAQAVWSMARTLCTDRPRVALAFATALLTLFLPATGGQLLAMALAGLIGWVGLRVAATEPRAQRPVPIPRRTALLCLLLFATLLLGLPMVARLSGSEVWVLVDRFYRVGALIFGGGHVILPLLQAVVVPTGLVDPSLFLAGYGAAQAVPGPLTTFAAFLGAVLSGPLSGWAGGMLLLVVIFLPSFLLVIGVLPFWEGIRHREGLRSALAGINAGVVGLLLAALYDPLWTGAILGRQDFALALAAFGLLVIARTPPLVVVVLGALGGWALA